MNCYCGSQKSYAECCEPFISGEEVPETPEQLMRSRYSAFCVKNTDYLKATTDPQLDIDWTANEDWANKATFTGLEVLKSSQEKNKGLVEFKAHFKVKDESHTHHEVAHFRRHQGQWFFREGRIQVPKTAKA